MATVHPARGQVDDNRRSLWLIVLIFVAVHGLLIVHDLTTADAFLQGDRAGIRLEKILYLLRGWDAENPFQYLTVDSEHGSSFVERLVELGSPGDYVLHAALYGLGGSTAVIAVQLVLALLSTLCVFWLAGLVGLTRRIAVIAAIVYALLPGSLMQPHTLVSEALYNPLVVIALTLIVRNVEADFRNDLFCLALALLAVAIFVRLQLLLFPLVLAAILVCSDRSRTLGRTAPILLICFVLPLAWMLLLYGQTGEVSMGSSDNSLGRNLFETSRRLAAIGGFPFDPSAYPSEEMPLSVFASAVVEHPAPYVRMKASDVANQFLNPGVNAFAGHYLGVLDTAQDWTYWKQIRDKEGLWGLIREIVRWGPAFALTFLGAVVVWGLFLACMAVGLIVFLRADRPSAASKAILLGYLAYGAAIVHVSSGVRWTHRTSIEFVMVLLFAAGLEGISRWRARS